MSFKTLTTSIFIFLLVNYVRATPFEALRDSIGAERKGDSWLVLHRVGSGETLSALARKYHTSVKAIQDENPSLAAGLKAGDVIKVPYLAAHKPATSGRKTHTVGSGQGLYSIARIYSVSVADLRAWNGLASDNIREGQELIVQGEKGARNVAISSPLDRIPASTAKRKTHQVSRGEGLSTIAEKYKVSLKNLRDWNNLSSNSIQVGQVLAVVAPDKVAENQVTEAGNTSRESEKRAVVVPPTRTEAATNVDTKRKPENKSSVKDAEDGDPTGMQAQAGEEEKQEFNRKETRTISNEVVVANTSGFPKVVEAGVAEAITASGDTEGYYALHRSAPVGTILQVRNEMNNLSVFVKVIGKLPDTGANDKLVVKITQKAYERLAAVDKRFRVEVTYLPN